MFTCMGGNIEIEMLRAPLNLGISQGSKDLKSDISMLKT